MTSASSWAGTGNNCAVGLDRLLVPDPGPFALLRRGSTTPMAGEAPPAQIDLLLGEVTEVERLADLPLPQTPRQGGGHDLLAVIPFRQIAERGFSCHDDGEPILALSVAEQGTVDVAEVVRRIDDVPIPLTEAGFDMDDESYGDVVRRVLTEEIGHGEGANFVIKREFTATIPGWSVKVALAVFRRLLLAEPAAYWTFLVYTGSRMFIGASPERQVSLTGGTVVMNPISGTYRYPPNGPALDGVFKFLADAKETDELYMVVDEELKMMARVCDSDIRVVGPRLKEMARLAHTEYFIEGRSTLGVREILRETMFAPTVTGSPLENACRVIARHEPAGRGYYSGALALIGRDELGQQALDSAILIRTAQFDSDGRVRMGIGATLVRESSPAAEAAETTAKAASMLAALGPVRPAAETLPTPGIGQHPAVRSVLRKRNAGLSTYWLGTDQGQRPAALGLAGREVLVVDAEDRFTTMLERMLRALGLSVTLAGYADAVTPTDYELVVIGPGPGDPRDHAHPKIAALRRLALDAIHAATPLLSICLGHQVLAGLLGFRLARKEFPNQGVQREIDLFGRTEKVGFYNSFTAMSEHDWVHCLGIPGRIEVSRDPATGDVHALRGPRFASVQFHPESVLTRNGSAIIAALLAAPLDTAVADLAPALLRS